MPSATLSLNVNSTGAKYIRLDPADNSGSDYTLSKYFTSDAGRVYEFVYDGTYWLLLTRDHDTDTNTTYTGSTPISVSGTTISHSTDSGYKHVPAHSFTTAGSYYLTNSSTAGAATWTNVFGKKGTGSYSSVLGDYRGYTSGSTGNYGYGSYSLTSGTLNSNSSGNSGVIGYNNTVGTGTTQFVAGYINTSNNNAYGAVIGNYNTVKGYDGTTTSSHDYNFVIGSSNDIYGTYSYVLGRDATVYGTGNVLIGTNNSIQKKTSGVNYATSYATLIGYNNVINNENNYNGTYSVLAGYQLLANKGYSQTIVGKYNKAKDGSNNASSANGFIFVVGSGSSSTRNCAMWVHADGTIYGDGTFSGSQTADYAECFEWSDSNLNNEDRRGRFVTIDKEDKIRFATAEDDYILGIVSAAPTVLGDAAAENWQGRFVTDIYGKYIEEEVEHEAIIDEETGEIIEPAHKEVRRKTNPNYDPDKPYTPRLERPEWDAIGMMGKLVLDDDGTCEVGGFAAPGKDGIATRGTSVNGYKVIARLDENHVRVIFK
jgi:hypothetical protein